MTSVMGGRGNTPAFFCYFFLIVSTTEVLGFFCASFTGINFPVPASRPIFIVLATAMSPFWQLTQTCYCDTVKLTYRLLPHYCRKFGVSVPDDLTEPPGILFPHPEVLQNKKGRAPLIKHHLRCTASVFPIACGTMQL